MSLENAYLDQPFLAEIYDHVPGHSKLKDVNLYRGLAAQTGGPVLELGCGTGRVLIPIARSGIKATGIDSSEHMLKVCRQNISREPEGVRANIKLVHADMRSFDIQGRFRLAFIPFNSFLHLLTVEDQLACLSAVHRRLGRDGRLALDVFNPDVRRLVDESQREEPVTSRPFTLPDGRRVLIKARTVSVDLHRQILETEVIHYVTEPSGRQERLVSPFTLRYIFRYEAEHLLARAGFEVEALLSDYRGTAYGSSYPGQLIFVARKKG